MPLPDYKNPPLNEVVLGVTFTPLQKMKTAHIGLFWNSIIQDFPKCEQAQVIGDGIDDIIEKETGAPIPRTWLISRDEVFLLQIQKNKLLFNWRKKESDYPRYPIVSEKFFEYFHKFNDFLMTNDLGPIEYKGIEFSYINNIPKGEGWKDWNSIGSLFPDMAWKNDKERFLPSPNASIWRSVYNLPDEKGTLIVLIQPGVRLTDNYPLIIFEMTARGRITDINTDEIKEWFNLSHYFMIRSFEDLTSEAVQKDIWGKVNHV